MNDADLSPTYFYIALIVGQVLCCCLAFNGYIISAGIIYGMFVPYPGFFAIALKSHRRSEIQRMSKPELFMWGGIEAAIVLIAGVLLLISCYSGYNLLVIKDPATTVKGITAAGLGDAYTRNPRAYDVYLTDGWVHELGVGYSSRSTGKSTVYYSAAPIYKDMASGAAGGPPLAWAIGNDDGYWKQLKGTYCPGGGVCGFKAEGYATLNEGLVFDNGWTSAAKEASSKGGFKWVNNLPAIMMGNPYESMQKSERFYNLFYHFLFFYVAGIVFGNVDVFIRKPGGESEPLL